MHFNKKILPNGARVITVPMKDNPTVTVLVMVEAGSKYENKKNNGISHFLEHMCFKGTEKRPNTSDISRELDSIGAHYNAFTAEELTGYFAKSHPKHLPKILEIVSDLYLNPVFDDKEIEKEKGVIIEEINMYEDLPMRKVQEVFMELLYGDQPAGWNIAGPKENIKKMSKKDFLEYRNSHYVSGATTIIIAGQFDEKEALKQIEKYFKDVSSGKKEEKKKVLEKQMAPKIAIKQKDIDQVHLAMGVRAFDYFNPKNPILRVLVAVLGGGMSSRLFQKMRDELGICYYVRAANELFTDHGFLEVSAGVDKNRVGEAVRAIMEEFKRFKTELVPKEELQKAKDYLIGNMYLGLESSDSVAEYYGFQEILKKPVKTPEEVVEEIKKITAEDIKSVANEIFQDRNLNFAAVGKVEEGKVEGELKF